MLIDFNQYIQSRVLDKLEAMHDVYKDAQGPANRQVCFQLNDDDFWELERICGFLGTSKKDFVAMAVLDRLIDVDRLITETLGPTVKRED